MSPAASRRAVAAVVVLILVGFGAPELHAQVEQDTTAAIDSVVVMPEANPVVVPAQDSVMPITPRGAFIRSMILPGWGQSEFDAYFRGGVYFAGWAANWYMNFRNYARLGDARSMFERRKDQLMDELIAAAPDDSVKDELRKQFDEIGLTDAQIRADDSNRFDANRLRKLVRAREQQREDWIAWSIFWLLASGVDAFVTAHLSDFPASIDVEPGQNGSVSLRMNVPIPGGWP